MPNLLSSIKVKFLDFLWVLGRPNQASDLQFCYLNLFDMPFQRSDYFLAYIQNKLADGQAFCNICAKF